MYFCIELIGITIHISFVYELKKLSLFSLSVCPSPTFFNHKTSRLHLKSLYYLPMRSHLSFSFLVCVYVDSEIPFLLQVVGGMSWHQNHPYLAVGSDRKVLLWKIDNI